jgi:Pseudouridylate synthases, 23S RNA-specific
MLSGKLAEIDLKTGRTHQIRATFKALRHPIIGDSLYGKENERGLLLFAVALQLQHPNNDKPLSFQLPQSNRYKAALKSFT